MGRARLRSKDFPSGGEDGAGEIEAGGRTFRFQHVSIGNPQCAIAVASTAELEALDLGAHRPARSSTPRCSRTGRTSRGSPSSTPGIIRARIFERGAGETTASGTGASGAAVAHVLRGGDSPVTVRLDGGELEVEVGEDLHVDLTGWAVPVYAGELSDADGVFAQGLGE